MSDDLDLEENPFSSKALENSVKPSYEQMIERRRAYFALPIAEKTQIQQQTSNRRVTVGIIRQEDKEMFGTSHLADMRYIQPYTPEDFLPETFHSLRRTGVKQFVEQTRKLCRLMSNTAMKEEEIRSINNNVMQRCVSLERAELQLNRREIELERQLREIEEFSIKGQKNDELSGYKLDQIYRKGDELGAVLDSLFQEVQRQTESLQLALSARDMIETVAQLGGYDLAHIISKREQIRRFFAAKPDDADLLTTRPPQCLQNKPALSKPPREQETRKLRDSKGSTKGAQLEPIQSDKLFPLRTKGVLALAQKYVSFAQTLTLYDVQKQLETQTGTPKRFEIAFSFQEFMEEIQNGFEQAIKPRTPMIMQYETLNDAKLVRNVDSPLLVRAPFNAFEQLLGVDCDERIMKAVGALVDSYEYPPFIPFYRPQDFNENMQLMEETTLVRTENLQDLKNMVDQQQKTLQNGQKSYQHQEEQLNEQIVEIRERIAQYRVTALGFDRSQIANSVDAFIYNLSKYQSVDELQVDKQSDELDILHQSIAQAGVFSGSIDPDDRASISNNILARMELILNYTVADMANFSAQQTKEARYVLDKKRREVARNAKMNEMMKQNEKQAERRKVREERLKKDKVIARQVVGKSYLDEKKKTQVQIQLEDRLKKEQMQRQGDEGDFYQ